MSIFQPPFVVAEDKTVIALRFVESVNMFRDGGDRVIDKLKDDVFIEMKTVSGITYTISARKQMEIIGKLYKLPDDPGEVRTAIFDRWSNLIGN